MEIINLVYILKVGIERCLNEDEFFLLVGVFRSRGRCNEDFEVFLLVGCFID